MTAFDYPRHWLFDLMAYYKLFIYKQCIFLNLLFVFIYRSNKLKEMVGPSILLEELAFAKDSHFINDWLYVLFNR